MLCGSEGNCRCGIAPAMHHLQAQWFREGDEYRTYTLEGHDTLYLYTVLSKCSYLMTILHCMLVCDNSQAESQINRTPKHQHSIYYRHTSAAEQQLGTI